MKRWWVSSAVSCSVPTRNVPVLAEFRRGESEAADTGSVLTNNPTTNSRVLVKAGCCEPADVQFTRIRYRDVRLFCVRIESPNDGIAATGHGCGRSERKSEHGAAGGEAVGGWLVVRGESINSYSHDNRADGELSPESVLRLPRAVTMT
jgi:hypothetical protein